MNCNKLEGKLWVEKMWIFDDIGILNFGVVVEVVVCWDMRFVCKRFWSFFGLLYVDGI